MQEEVRIDIFLDPKSSPFYGVELEFEPF